MNSTRALVATTFLALAAAACAAPAARTSHTSARGAVRVDAGVETAVSHGDRTLPYVAPEPEPVTETPFTVATTAPSPKPSPTASRLSSPHFRTPEGAMRYLARAYNANDVASLKHVTTPSARSAMLEMRKYAPDLRLDECHRDRQGAMGCSFSHANPGKSFRGSAIVMVAPAAKPGWYMTALVDCGED